METAMKSEAVRALLEWYEENKRDLPWRHTRDPYRIWISEIMLQQTRVEAVKPYYARFLKAFPTVTDLARAPSEKLLKLWEGLGYYSRARNLQRAAQEVVARYGGEMPSDEQALRALPGIGDYTAGAIASIAFDIPAPAVDGNVLRVLSRLNADESDIALQQTKKMWNARLRLSVPKEAGSFTQALIELGATVCVPNAAPKCESCPLADFCLARERKLTEQIPVKSAKKGRRIENRTVLVIGDGERYVIGKRPEKGLLAGLYELPNVGCHMGESEALALVRALGFEPLRIGRLEDSKHIFTHIEWNMIAYEVLVSPEFDGFSPQNGLFLADVTEIRERYAFPGAFSAYTQYLRKLSKSDKST